MKGKYKVLIGVYGGVADMIAAPDFIDVEIRDFDNNEHLEEGQEPVKAFTPQELLDVTSAEPLTEFIPEAADVDWDDVEVHPVRDVDGEGSMEPCEDYEADFWSVYVHLVGGGVNCVADLPTKDLADTMADLLLIAGKNYKRK